MTVIGLFGDRTTTTAMALAVSWPGNRPATLIEADPTGGSLLGWLDDPSTLGRRTLRRAGEIRRPLGTPIDDFLRDLDHRPAGDITGNTEGDVENAGGSVVRELDFITAPVHPLEAERAVSRLPFASPGTHRDSLWGRWSAGRICLVDLGSRPHRPLDGVDPSALDLLVVVLAQRSASEGAAAAHIGRMSGIVDQLRSLGDALPPVAVLVVGDRPFDPFEVGDHIRSRLGVVGHERVGHERVGHETANEPGSGVFVLPSDPLAAAVLAGRAGMSARRWSKTQLGRAAAFAARELAELTHDGLDDPVLDHHAEAVGG